MLLSCLNIDRDKPVDKSKLRGRDYRLFQDTPAWELAKAVQDGNEKKINDIVDKKPELINYQEPKFGNTLLMLTVCNQQMKSFKILLDKDADVNIHDTCDGTSALIDACGLIASDIMFIIFNQFDNRFAEMLIEHGANVNDIETGERRQGNSTRYTPLMMASEECNITLVKLLISKGANVNYQNEFDQSALSKCVMLGKYEVALYLLQNGADYTQPIYYIPEDNRADYIENPPKKIPVYLIDILREGHTFDLSIKNEKYRKKVIDFLKDKEKDNISPAGANLQFLPRK